MGKLALLEDLIILRAALDAGSGPLIALQHAGRDSELLRPIISQLAAGRSLKEIVMEWEGDMLLRRVLSSLAIADEAGCSSAETIDTVIESIRQEQILTAHLNMKSREAIITGKVLSFLPVVGLLGSYFLTASSSKFLTSPVGIGLIAVVAVLILASYLWMSRLGKSVHRVLRESDPYLQARNAKPSALYPMTGFMFAGILGYLLGGVVGGLVAAGIGSSVGAFLASKYAPIQQDWFRDSYGYDNTISNTPTAELIEMLALALQSGRSASQGLTLIAPYMEPAIKKLCLNCAASLHIHDDPCKALPPFLNQVAKILYAQQSWGAPIVTTLWRYSQDIRIRANEAATTKAEEIGTALSIPTTLLLVPAFGLSVSVPIIVPMFMEVIQVMK